MKCNYRPPKLTKDEREEMAHPKSVPPLIDRITSYKNQRREALSEDEAHILKNSNNFWKDL